MTTNNLNLVTYNKGVDPDQSFQQYRTDLDGISNSNMTKIDDFAGSLMAIMLLSSLNASGCITQFTNFTNDLYQPIWPLNGGFETAGSGGGDLFANWQESYGAGGSGSFIRMSGSGHTGNYAAYVSGSAANLSQYSGQFWSGSSYTFEFWSYGDGVNQGVAVAWDSTSGSYIGTSTYRTPISGSWNKNIISGSVPATPVGFHTASLLLYGPPGTGTGKWVLYDDVRAYNASGSIAIATSALNVIENKFKKLGSFSGAGQADFSGISGAFSHILVLGTAAVDTSASFANVGIDFDGDSGSGNYTMMYWQNSGSEYPYTEYTTGSNTIGQITLARVNHSITDGFGSMFLAIIPNYSASAGLYKTAMGVSIFQDVDWVNVAIQGGTWLSTCPINRIRFFGSSDTITRQDFFDGTTITLYGIV